MILTYRKKSLKVGLLYADAYKVGLEKSVLAKSVLYWADGRSIKRIGDAIASIVFQHPSTLKEVEFLYS